MITITADGMAWPLETFLDAYGFTRTSALDLYPEHPLLSRDELVEAVTESGELITDKAARHLPWGEVIAIKAVDGRGLQLCENCGDFSVTVAGNSWCDDCLGGEAGYCEVDIPDGGAALAAARTAEAKGNE